MERDIDFVAFEGVVGDGVVVPGQSGAILKVGLQIRVILNDSQLALKLLHL